MHPRMQLIIHSSLVTVQFGDTVTICSRGKQLFHTTSLATPWHAFYRTENEYMDRLELKSTSDRTLGVGVIESENSFLVLTAATLMKTYVDPDAVGQFDPEWVLMMAKRRPFKINTIFSRGKANLIQSTMTQAILYGSHKDVGLLSILLEASILKQCSRIPCILAFRRKLMKMHSWRVQSNSVGLSWNQVRHH